MVVVENGYNSFFVEASEVEQSTVSIRNCFIQESGVHHLEVVLGDEVFEDTPNTPIDRNDKEPSVSLWCSSVLGSIRARIDTKYRKS